LNPASALTPAFVLLLAALPASGQDWDPVKSATGWASFDRDGSCVFHDPGARSLRVWSRDAGTSDMLPLSRLDVPPEMWVLDPAGDAWIVTSTTLQRLEKTGKVGTTHSLPAEVADLAWDARSFVLSYRTREPYLERRDLKGGSVMWTYGVKPSKGGLATQVRHRVAIREDGKVLLTSGESLRLDVLDIEKGARIGTEDFTMKGKPLPLLALADGDRGGLAWWMNNNVALMAVPAYQLPPGEAKGLMLARLDLATHDLQFLATGADAKAVLVGILENTAVLRGPAGGLTFVPIP